MKTIDIPPASARCFEVRKGQIVRIIDVEGKQVGDFTAFNLVDLKEKFSTGRTRTNNFPATLRVSTGNKLLSQRNQVMFNIINDTCGVHDLLYPPCCRWVFQYRYKVDPKDGCLEKIAACLSDRGISIDDIPDPLNVFMRTEIEEDGQIKILEPVSAPGDYIDLRAEMDCLVAISSCSVDVGSCNAGKLKPLRVIIADEISELEKA